MAAASVASAAVVKAAGHTVVEAFVEKPADNILGLPA